MKHPSRSNFILLLYTPAAFLFTACGSKHNIKEVLSFAGDNVSNSRDSRYFGFVPEDFVIGVVPRYSERIRPPAGSR